jgi:hypothetical protein
MEMMFQWRQVQQKCAPANEPAKPRAANRLKSGTDRPQLPTCYSPRKEGGEEEQKNPMCSFLGATTARFSGLINLVHG